jgi:hypothetical protein
MVASSLSDYGVTMKRTFFILIVLALNASAALAYDPAGSGKISNGNCVCKNQCDQFAKAGQLTPPQIAECKSNCQQKYAGCNKGSQR